MKTALCCLVVVGVSLTSPAQENHRNSQNEPTNPVTRVKSWEHHLRLKDKSIYKDLKWRQAGPAFQRVGPSAFTGG